MFGYNLNKLVNNRKSKVICKYLFFKLSLENSRYVYVIPFNKKYSHKNNCKRKCNYF